MAAARLDAGDQLDEVVQFLGRRQEDVEQAVPDLGDQGRRRACPSSSASTGASLDGFGLGRAALPRDASGSALNVVRGGSQLIESSGSRSPAGESPSSSTMRPRRSCQSALAQPSVVVAAVQRQHVCGGLDDRVLQPGQQLAARASASSSVEVVLGCGGSPAGSRTALASLLSASS